MHAHRPILVCLLAFLFTCTFTAPAGAAQAVPHNNLPSAIETEHIAVVGTLVDDDPNLKLGAPFTLWGDFVVFRAQQNGANPSGFALVAQSGLNGSLSNALHSFVWTQARIDAAAVTDGGLLATLQYDARPGAEGNRSSLVVYALAGANPPQVVGRYQMAKQVAITENRINDMVVMDDYAMLKAASLSSSPSFAFAGLIVIDLAQPDDETLEYSEVQRVAADLGIAGELQHQGTRLYVANATGADILVFNVASPTAPNLLATLPVVSSFRNWIVAGLTQLVGQRVPVAMALINVLEPSAPTETVLGGEFFTPLTQLSGVDLLAGPTLLAKGRGHDLLVLAIDQPQANLAPYALTAGWIDFEAGSPASEDILILPSHDFIVSTGTGSDKFVLRHDGFAPHFELKSEGAGVTVDGVPLAAGQARPIDIHSQVRSSQADTRVEIDSVCNDEEIFHAFALAGVGATTALCQDIADADERQSCIDRNQLVIVGIFLRALGLLCRGDAPPVTVPPVTVPTVAALVAAEITDSSVITLTTGALKFEALADEANYAIVTPFAHVEVSSGGVAEVVHDTTLQLTYVAATANPLMVTPTNPGLAAVMLEPHEAVRITADAVSPVETVASGYGIYLPAVSKP